MNILNEIIEIVSSVLECSTSELNEQSGLLNTFNWDSLNHVTIVYEIEEHFGITIPDEKIVSLQCIKDFVEFVNKEKNYA